MPRQHVVEVVHVHRDRLARRQGRTRVQLPRIGPARKIAKHREAESAGPAPLAFGGLAKPAEIDLIFHSGPFHVVSLAKAREAASSLRGRRYPPGHTLR